MSELTGLKSVAGTLTGPRCLRTALREKTTPIRTLMAALDGPGELRVRIPASVFGGDIFGVMSRQLREALVFAPPAVVVPTKPRRKRALQSINNPLTENPKDLFSSVAYGVKQSTLSSEPIDNISTLTAPFLLNTPPSPGRQESDFEGSAERVSKPRAGEAPAISGTQTNQLPVRSIASSTRRGAQSEPALVSSLKRYWDSISQIRGTQSQTTSLTEAVSSTSPPAHVREAEQPLATRDWPSLPGRDVPARLSSFDDPRPKATRQSSRPDPQTQNIFDLSANHANQPSPTYDDLGERIAEILHEQALQHGIDVT